MEKCGFFDANLNGEEYDRVYLAAQFARYFASFIGNGVYAQHGDQLQVMAQSTPAMSVQVLSGQGWINGYWYENSGPLSLSVDVADGVLARIDSIVLRIGFSERNVWLAIKKGAPAATPVAPALTRSADYYELQLATISIPAGSIKITQAQITDTRMNKSVCGWVTGVVDQIDTTTLFSQFEAYLEEFKANNEAEFTSWTEEQRAAYLAWIATQESDFDTWYNAHTVAWQNQFTTWFQTIKDQLGEDAAGQLQNQINALEERLDALPGAYVLPAATRTSLGGVKIAGALDVDSTGQVRVRTTNEDGKHAGIAAFTNSDGTDYLGVDCGDGLEIDSNGKLKNVYSMTYSNGTLAITGPS